MKVKKCQTNVSISLILIIILLFIIGYLFIKNHEKGIQKDDSSPQKIIIPINYTPNYPYTNVIHNQKDVLLNPYTAPYKDERYIQSMGIGLPINVSTNISAVDTNYRQLGIITPLNSSSKDNILPIMGRPLFTSRDKWQYYTISNQHNNIKLPISVKGKSALNDYGVDKVFSGDTIYVEGYNEAFKVTIYDNDTIKYIPYI
jgi:hypothetical protein